jgi:hypothetical protein
MRTMEKIRSSMKVLTGKAVAINTDGKVQPRLPKWLDEEDQPTSAGIYTDIVKRPVRDRPRPIADIKAEAKKRKLNEKRRLMRAKAKRGKGSKKVKIS